MQERYKECPNPTCKAHLEHWEFFDNEEFCSVCGEQLHAAGVATPAPTNRMAAVAAAEERPYIDSYMEVHNASSTPLGLILVVIGLLIVLLLGWALFSIFAGGKSNTAAVSRDALATAIAQETAVAAAATSTALAASDVSLGMSGNATASGNSGAYATATPAPLLESTPIPLAQGGTFMIHNIGMVASCTDSTLKPTYKPNEHFFVMVQADFSRTQVYEIHPLWQMPPNYSTVIDAKVEAMSIDNPAPSLRLRDGGMYYVCFEAIPPKPQNVWTVGNYRVDIYINNGTLPVISKDFAVIQ
ncbi:MAG: hypothetical protein DLM69_03700 [Candidatus Chloroheliales bacterium]|nr:MAG: hypothetical protein DLM69_03700 [Chloroflexota bacterium]